MDIVLENFRPGRLASWGLDWAMLCRLYPHLIMVSISGFGQTGPYRQRPGFGNIAEAMGGLRSVTGYEDSPPSMMEAAVTEYVHCGVIPRRMGNRLARSAPSGVYPTKDGGWVAIGANGDNIFPRFAKTIGREDWLADPCYAHNRGRVRHADELDEAITRFTSEHTMQEVLDILEAAEVLAGPVQSVWEIASDPHLRARQAIVEVPCPALGGQALTMLGVVPVLAEAPGAVRTPGGPVGRDTAAVLAEFLGLGPEEQAALAARGVIRVAETDEETEP